MLLDGGQLCCGSLNGLGRVPCGEILADRSGNFTSASICAKTENLQMQRAVITVGSRVRTAVWARYWPGSSIRSDSQCT